MVLQRWAGIAGIAFVALTVVAEAIASKPNEPATSDQRLLDLYNDSGNQYRLFAAALLAVAAGMFFLWFVVGLRERLSTAEPVSGAPTALAFAAGVVFVAV